MHEEINVEMMRKAQMEDMAMKRYAKNKSRGLVSGGGRGWLIHSAPPHVMGMMPGNSSCMSVQALVSLSHVTEPFPFMLLMMDWT